MWMHLFLGNFNHYQSHHSGNVLHCRRSFCSKNWHSIIDKISIQLTLFAVHGFSSCANRSLQAYRRRSSVSICCWQLHEICNSRPPLQIDIPGLSRILSRTASIFIIDRLVFGRPVCWASLIDPVCCVNFSLTLFTIDEGSYITILTIILCEIFELWPPNFQYLRFIWNIIQQWKHVFLSCTTPF